MRKLTLGTMTLILTLFTGFAWAGTQLDLEKLGHFLYKDKNLSSNKNQSCETCHHPSAGFADPDNRKYPTHFPVSEGSVPGLFGGRNAPSSAYAGFSPVFFQDPVTGECNGGMFWDGRATGATLDDPLAEQALGPFENPVEMNMTRDLVVATVQASNYVHLFYKVFPDTNFTDINGTYNNIGFAIAAFERSSPVTRFNSVFDQFWLACQAAGIAVNLIDSTTDLASLPQGILTTAQMQGLALFNDPTKGNCAACHLTTSEFVDAQGNLYPPIFTDFSYDNLGIPTNQRVYDLAGGSPPDPGLGGRPDITDAHLQKGKFKVPTLRNVAKSAPYGHNGYFTTLNEIVNFYNTRDVAVWPAPDVSENMNTVEIGALDLNPDEELQIVAFLHALTDK